MNFLREEYLYPGQELPGAEWPNNDHQQERGGKKRLQKAAAIASAALALMGATPSFSAAQPARETTPFSSTDTNTPERTADNLIMSPHERQVEKMHNAALYDDTESAVFLITTSDGTEVVVPDQERDENRVATPYSEFRRQLPPGNNITRLTWAHTHPLSGLASKELNIKTKDELSEVRKDKNKLSPLPPSIVDISNIAISEMEFGTYDASLMERIVIEPTGIWKFKEIKDPHSPFAELSRLLLSYKTLKRTLLEKKQETTYAEKQDLEARWKKLKNFIETNEEFSKIFEIQGTLFELTGNKDPKAKEDGVKEYIAECHKAGIEMIYQPFEK